MNKPIQKICTILVDRANYGRMKPVMQEIKRDSDLELLTVCSGTMLLERFGNSYQVVISDGFNIDGQVFLEVEGSTPVTMTKSIGMGIIEFSSEFQRLQPDLVLVIGDRYEALAASIAAVYMNIPLAHIQGGEVSGSIDESARHAISKLAHLHFPSTDRSARYLIKMGEDPKHVHNVGCPSGDYIIPLKTDLSKNSLNRLGVGAELDFNQPFFLVIFHPNTTKYGDEVKQISELISALDEIAHPTLWIWPNIDAGSDRIAKSIRTYREKHDLDSKWLRLVKNLNPESYQKALKSAVCAIGNSSSFIRDSTFSGTPVVLVGDRQFGREHGKNLLAVKPQKKAIIKSIYQQLKHGRYPAESLYGDGQSSSKIISKIKQFKPYPQKTLHYVFDDEHPNT